MPTRITPLDVKSYTNAELYRLGAKIFENALVKHRFQTDYGLRASVRGKGNYHVKMIVENEQLFGRCSCAAGTTPPGKGQGYACRGDCEFIGDIS